MIKNSYYKDLFKSLLKKLTFTIPIIIILMIFLLGFTFNYFVNHSAIKINFDNSFIFPNDEYLLGTNAYGQSMLHLVFISAYNTLIFAFLISLVNVLLGFIIGIIWGYSHKFDSFMIVIKNIFDNIPATFFYVIIFIALGSGFWSLLFAAILFNWIKIACLVRNNLLLIRNKDYNKMSKLLKTSPLKIAVNNYLPSLLPIVFNSIAISFPQIISIEVIFSYFGFSFSNSSFSLGKLLFNSIFNNSCFSHPYLFFVPLAAISIINFCYFYISKTISTVSNKEEVKHD